MPVISGFGLQMIRQRKKRFLEFCARSLAACLLGNFTAIYDERRVVTKRRVFIIFILNKKKPTLVGEKMFKYAVVYAKHPLHNCCKNDQQRRCNFVKHH